MIRGSLSLATALLLWREGLMGFSFTPTSFYWVSSQNIFPAPIVLSCIIPQEQDCSPTSFKLLISITKPLQREASGRRYISLSLLIQTELEY